MRGLVLHRCAELAAAGGVDAARAADLVFLGRQRQRVVGFLLRFVRQPARLRIEAELVAIARVGDRLRTLHDVQAEIERVPAEDVAHVAAADHDHFEARFFGDAFETGRTHLARRSDRKPIAGDQKRLSPVHALAEVGHQVTERSRLPALVERLEAFRHAVGGRRDLIRVDGVELLLLARDLQVPEDERLAANRRAGARRGIDGGGRRDRLDVTPGLSRAGRIVGNILGTLRLLVS